MKLKTHWIPLILSGISALIAAGSLIYSINTSSDTVSQKEFKSLQQNIQAIKTEFNGENKELKERLYKVEMLIAVYENDKEIDRKR